MLILCAVLALWRPLGFAVELPLVLPSLGMRGIAGAIELLFHGAVAVLAIAAVRALAGELPLGPPLAAAALVASAAATVQSLYWSALPNQTVPGSELTIATLAVLHALVWLIYLKRSRRVHAIMHA
ncbi:MAG TPA: hypothetical protein VFJ02_23300 [Vicinamibacterales bacterium]|nr:hypothetical protein [Vicinamibacterales bacterium]